MRGYDSAFIHASQSSGISSCSDCMCVLGLYPEWSLKWSRFTAKGPHFLLRTQFSFWEIEFYNNLSLTVIDPFTTPRTSCTAGSIQLPENMSACDRKGWIYHNLCLWIITLTFTPTHNPAIQLFTQSFEKQISEERSSPQPHSNSSTTSITSPTSPVKSPLHYTAHLKDNKCPNLC